MTDKLRKALRDSLLRTHWVLSHPSVSGMVVMAAVHGATYDGPVWTKQPEIQAAFKLAGLPLDLPTPKYAETEAGVFKKKYQEVTAGTFTFVEHAWELPNPDDALFLGTFAECYQWAKDHHIEDNVIFTGSLPPDPTDSTEYYVQNTGREIDNGEEAAFFAQFEECDHSSAETLPSQPDDGPPNRRCLTCGALLMWRRGTDEFGFSELRHEWARPEESGLPAFEALGALVGMDADDLRARVLGAARTNTYPGEACISQGTVERWLQGYDLSEAEKLHAKSCAPCAALLELLPDASNSFNTEEE